MDRTNNMLLTAFIFTASTAGLFGQGADAPPQRSQSETTPSQTANRDRRLDSAVAEIAALKRLLVDQGQRISALERSVRALQPAAPSAAARALATWDGIKLGMSRVQVLEILGEPKFTESVVDRQTLLYGNDTVSPAGRVTIVDDRVTQVEYSGRVMLAVPAK